MLNIYIREVEHKLLSDHLYNRTFHELFECWPSSIFASYRLFKGDVSRKISDEELVSKSGLENFMDAPLLDRADFLDFKELVFKESAGGRVGYARWVLCLMLLSPAETISKSDFSAWTVLNLSSLLQEKGKRS